MKYKTLGIDLHLEQENVFDPSTEYLSGIIRVHVEKKVDELFYHYIGINQDVNVYLSRMPKEVQDAAKNFFDLVRSYIDKSDA